MEAALLIIVGNPWLRTNSSVQSSWQLVRLGCLGVPVSLCGDQLLLAALTCPQRAVTADLVRPHGTGPPGLWQARWDQIMSREGEGALGVCPGATWYCCLSLDQLPNFSVPQGPNLLNGDPQIPTAKGHYECSVRALAYST